MAPGRMSPERTCIGCKAKRGQGELLRLACAASGQVAFDHSGRAPGRGAYVCCDVQCLRKALKSSRLDPAFRQTVIVPSLEAACRTIVPSLYDRLGACLSIAQRAGGLASGYMALRHACRRNRVVYLVLAENAAAQRAAEYQAWCGEQDIPYVTLFTKEELGRRIGKASRSAVGLLNPQFREPFCAALTLLRTFEASLEAGGLRKKELSLRGTMHAERKSL